MFSILPLIIVFIFFIISIVLTINNERNLFSFFLATIFICNIIPDISGIRITENLPLINVQKIFDLILFSALLLIPLKNRKEFDKHIFILLIIFISARFISVFNSTNFNISIQYWLNALLTIYLYYFVIVRLIDSFQKMNKVIKVLFYTGVVVAISNYFEFITGINIAHLFPNVSNVLEFWEYDRSGISRVFGLKADPVVSAYYLTFILPLGIYLYNIEKRSKWLYLSVIIVIALFLNLTRASIVAVTIMLFVYFILIVNQNRMKIITAFVLIIILIITYNPTEQFFSDIISLTNKNETQGFDYTRIYGFLDSAPTMIANIPFWGIGTGSLVRQDLMYSYFDKIGFLYSTSSIRTELPFFITILIDSGYIASLSFSFLLIVVIKKSFSIVIRSKERETKIESYLLLIFIGYFIALTSNGIFDSFNIIYIMIGMLNAVNNINRNYSQD